MTLLEWSRNYLCDSIVVRKRAIATTASMNRFCENWELFIEDSCLEISLPLTHLEYWVWSFFRSCTPLLELEFQQACPNERIKVTKKPPKIIWKLYNWRIYYCLLLNIILPLPTSISHLFRPGQIEKFVDSYFPREYTWTFLNRNINIYIYVQTHRVFFLFQWSY